MVSSAPRGIDATPGESKSTVPAPGERSAQEGTPAFDFARLERAVAALAECRSQLADENRELRRALAERDESIRTQSTHILGLNQRREDALKRLDELIAHVGALEARFADPGR